MVSRLSGYTTLLHPSPRSSHIIPHPPTSSTLLPHPPTSSTLLPHRPTSSHILHAPPTSSHILHALPHRSTSSAPLHAHSTSSTLSPNCSAFSILLLLALNPTALLQTYSTLSPALLSPFPHLPPHSYPSLDRWLPRLWRSLASLVNLRIVECRNEFAATQELWHSRNLPRFPKFQSILSSFLKSSVKSSPFHVVTLCIFLLLSGW
jgi:hypothetical protein